MSREDHINSLMEKIGPLSIFKKAVFGYLCVKRLAPNYHIFCEKENWGDNTFFIETLRDIEQNILESSDIITIKDIDKKLKYMDSITPDTEDFGEIYASHALDACISLILLLKFLKERNDKLLIQISEYCIETIYMHIADQKAGSSDKEIFSNLLMIKELAIQEFQLYYLQSDKKMPELFLKLDAIQFNKNRGILQ